MTWHDPPTIVLATGNPGKQAEFKRLLPGSVRVLDLDQANVSLPPETGTSFAEIAAVKALAAAEQSNLLSLADDSGLVVDALGGAPGVRSARYAGEPPSDERNRAALLAAMAEIPEGERSARFVCAVAIARRGRLVVQAEGVCEGSIARTAAGEFGFGYDPIFVLADGRRMAELLAEEKNRVSHRAVAYRQILPDLLRELGLSAHPAADR